MTGGYRPAYLRAVVVYAGASVAERATVLVRRAGRGLLPKHVAARLDRDDPARRADSVLGEVTARAGPGGRIVWGFDGSRSYRSAREAGEALAVHRVEGAAARERFDNARSS